MSLHEVYSLAHTAECRLQLSNSRPDRDLRVVVGHLMHYESLRLRIVEIEHNIGRAYRASTLAKEHQSEHASAPPGRSSDSSAQEAEDLDDDVDFEDEDDEADNELGLTRFPSGRARTPPLLADEGDEDEALDEPVSPEEPSDSMVDRILKRPADTELTQQLERIRNCPCHGKTDAPRFENVWELPVTPSDRPGVTRAVAQVAT